MSLKRIFTIFRKDLRDAIRDARVLVALILPLGIGIFYNITFDDSDTTLEAKIAFYSAESSTLPNTLTGVVGDSVDLQFFAAESEAQVQRELQDENADLGIIIPPGFESAIRDGEQPQLTLLQPASPTIAGNNLIAALDPTIRLMAGQSVPAVITVANAGEPTESESAIDKIGLRNWAVLASITMMVAMISMLALPVILAEEKEKKTLDALVLVSSMREVIAAKAFLGLFYVAVMVPLLLAITTFRPVDYATFAVVILLLTITLVGLGLLMAGFFNNANQLNTWSGIVLLPVIAPAFIIGVPAPDALRTIAELFPTGAGTKLLMNSVSTEQVFSGTALSFVVIVIWGVAAYALLSWQLSRRQS